MPGNIVFGEAGLSVAAVATVRHVTEQGMPHVLRMHPVPHGRHWVRQLPYAVAVKARTQLDVG